MATNLTENEKRLLLAIRDSEFNSGDRLEAVWVDCVWGFEGKRLFSGVMSSLVKKGLAQSDSECCWLTRAGLEAVSDEAYLCTIDRGRGLVPCPSCGNHDEMRTKCEICNFTGVVKETVNA